MVAEGMENTHIRSRHRRRCGGVDLDRVLGLVTATTWLWNAALANPMTLVATAAIAGAVLLMSYWSRSLPSSASFGTTLLQGPVHCGVVLAQRPTRCGVALSTALGRFRLAGG